MNKVCTLCRGNIIIGDERSPGGSIAGHVCGSCSSRFNTGSAAADLKAMTDGIDAPILVMQAAPRQVYAANKNALELFKKKPDQIEKHRGGQVFDCVHSFTEAGCGKDIQCLPCKIKNAIVETLTTGRPNIGIATVLEIKKGAAIQSYFLQVSTEKIGEMALVRIDKYRPTG